MKTYVIADIHGAHKALVQAIERSPFNPEEDMLISLGDIADGWPEVPQCVEYLLGIPNLIAIRGNHDMWCRQWVEYGEVTRAWKSQGGEATLKAYSEGDYDMERHREFFKLQIPYHIDTQNRGFVHGGFTSRKGLGHDEYQSNYFWDRDLWNLAVMSDNAYHKGTLDKEGSPQGCRMLKHKEIFIGHTTTGMWKYKHNGVLRVKDTTNPDCKVGKPITTPIQACNVWNLDTGGGWEGKVTIMDIDSKEYWQSDFVTELYPGIKGRR